MNGWIRIKGESYFRKLEEKTDKMKKDLELTMKNIPKIDNKIMIGYSNLSNLFSTINFLDELSTNKDDKSINTLK